MGSDGRRRRAGHESRIFAAALLAGLPAVLVATWLLWSGARPLRVEVTVSLVVVGAWLVGAGLVRERVLRPLQTIANLLAALREGRASVTGWGWRCSR
jgi:two-component system, NtrC family, nitrogen regulation sensor histidine kinase NtrY